MYLTEHLALAAHDPDPALREPVDWHEIVDALHRFGLGQDLLDRSLFCSAFATDAELDVRPRRSQVGDRQRAHVRARHHRRHDPGHAAEPPPRL